MEHPLLYGGLAVTVGGLALVSASFSLYCWTGTFHDDNPFILVLRVEGQLASVGCRASTTTKAFGRVQDPICI
ncbi:hypothetical protein BKA70DRAFT_1253759 [Coprinopsis sp. MPI-PUGE-AT-0042]|nr:hypothetical protein BKA70DRAFT_1253759 [Coprinopsis sp. MPI-PUGE-AT-0042]